VLAGINDPIRQAHYLQKLARLVKVDMNAIKDSLNRLKPSTAKRRAAPPRPTLSAARDRREEYCLALLLQHPELKECKAELTPECFEKSENRAIYNAYTAAPDVVSLKEAIDPAIHEHLDAIVAREIPAAKNNLDQKLIDCALELRKKYLKNLAARKGESGGEAGDDSRLEEDMEISRQLKELDARRSRKRNPYQQ
jgi:hypothetical protein